MGPPVKLSMYYERLRNNPSLPAGDVQSRSENDYHYLACPPEGDAKRSIVRLPPPEPQIPSCDFTKRETCESCQDLENREQVRTQGRQLPGRQKPQQLQIQRLQGPPRPLQPPSSASSPFNISNHDALAVAPESWATAPQFRPGARFHGSSSHPSLATMHGDELRNGSLYDLAGSSAYSNAQQPFHSQFSTIMMDHADLQAATIHTGGATQAYHYHQRDIYASTLDIILPFEGHNTPQPATLDVGAPRSDPSLHAHPTLYGMSSHNSQSHFAQESTSFPESSSMRGLNACPDASPQLRTNPSELFTSIWTPSASDHSRLAGMPSSRPDHSPMVPHSPHSHPQSAWVLNSGPQHPSGTTPISHSYTSSAWQPHRNIHPDPAQESNPSRHNSSRLTLSSHLHPRLAGQTSWDFDADSALVSRPYPHAHPARKSQSTDLRDPPQQQNPIWPTPPLREPSLYPSPNPLRQSRRVWEVLESDSETSGNTDGRPLSHRTGTNPANSEYQQGLNKDSLLPLRQPVQREKNVRTSRRSNSVPPGFVHPSPGDSSPSLDSIGSDNSSDASWDTVSESEHSRGRSRARRNRGRRTGRLYRRLNRWRKPKVRMLRAD
ncbi:MAG: hypothetical protein Q9160_007649 [Pyrenula sp. 1 TL-2023]